MTNFELVKKKERAIEMLRTHTVGDVSKETGIPTNTLYTYRIKRNIPGVEAEKHKFQKQEPLKHRGKEIIKVYGSRYKIEGSSMILPDLYQRPKG